jgi:hypothetical protein
MASGPSQRRVYARTQTKTAREGGFCETNPFAREARWRYYAAFGRASETTILRPSRSEPLSLEIAASASASDSISTKPKPRERPVILSMRTSAFDTAPACSKCFLKPSDVVAQAIEPTKILFDILYIRTLRSTRTSGTPVHYAKCVRTRNLHGYNVAQNSRKSKRRAAVSGLYLPCRYSCWASAAVIARLYMRTSSILPCNG